MNKNHHFKCKCMKQLSIIVSRIDMGKCTGKHKKPHAQSTINLKKTISKLFVWPMRAREIEEFILVSLNTAMKTCSKRFCGKQIAIAQPRPSRFQQLLFSVISHIVCDLFLILFKLSQNSAHKVQPHAVYFRRDKSYASQRVRIIPIMNVIKSNFVALRNR